MAVGAGERAFLLRVGVRDADTAIRELERFGSAGIAAGRSIVSASTPASRSLAALSSAAVEVRGRIDGLVSSTGSVGAVLGRLGPAGLAAAAGIGAAAVATRQFMSAVRDGDQLQKFADRVGVSSAALQELRFAAERSGVEAGTLDRALQGLTRRAAEAAKGQGELLGVAKEYGLTLTDSAGRVRSTVDLLGDLSDVIRQTGDESEELRIVTKAFGEEAGGMVNLLRQGREGMDGLRERARELGLVLNEDLLRGAERTADALDTFGSVIRLNVNRALLELAPYAAAAAEKVTDLFAAMRRFSELKRQGLELAGAALFPEFPQLRGLDEAGLQQRLAVQTQALDVVRNAPAALKEAAARSGKALKDVERELVEEIAEIRRRLHKQVVTVFDWDMALAGDTGAGDAAAFAAGRKALAELKAALDPLAKIEQERAERLAELDKIARQVNLTEAERLALIEGINKAADEAIERTKDQTKAAKDAAAAAREQARRDAELAREKDQVREGLERLTRTYSQTDAAAADYLDTLELLGRAAELGVISEEELARRVGLAEQAWHQAEAAASRYGRAVRSAGDATDAFNPRSFDVSGTLRSTVDNLFSGLQRGGGLSSSLLRDIVVSNIGGRIGDFALDQAFGGDLFGSGPSSVLSTGFRQVVDAVTGLGSSLSAAVFGTAPGAAAAAGVAPVVGGLTNAGTAGLLGTYGLGAAALPVAGIALAGLALILSKAFTKKSSGPALGASFGIDDGAIGKTRVGADNGADVDNAQSLADAVKQFTNTFLTATGARLLPGAFAGELGYQGGRYATSISSPGLTDGDKRKGRSPDLKTFGAGEGAAERATADFIVRSFLDALNRGLVEGLTDTTADVVRSVLGRLDRDGGAKTLEDAGKALDFARGFEDSTARMNAAGDAAALQLLDLSTAAKQSVAAQGASLKEFADNLTKFFGEVQREPVGTRVDGIDAAGRIAVSSLPAELGGDNNQRVGFRFGAGVYYQQNGDDGSVSFRDAISGAVIPAIRDATGELLVMADAIGAIASDAALVTDFGDPGRLFDGRAALDHYVDTLLGIADNVDTEPLTGYALALAQGRASLDEFREVLTDLGLTADEANGKLVRAREALAERVRDEFDRSIQDQLLAIRSPGAGVLAALSENLDRLVREAREVGGDEGAVRELFARQVEAQVRQEEVAAIQEGIQARAAEISTLQQTVTRVDGLVRSLATTRAALLRSSSLSPLSPAEELAAALDQFRQARDAGAAGDEGAAARANALASEVLQLARAVEASGPGYRVIFNEIDAGLAALEGRFTSDLEISRRQLSELEGIRAALGDQLAALTGRNTAAGRDFGAKPTRNRALAALFPEFTGNFGAGGFSAFYGGLSASDPRRATADNIISTVGYAAGGDHPGGLRIVGERGPELEATGPARIFSADQTAAILARASAAGSAGGDRVEALLGSLVSAVQGQARALDAFARQVLQVSAARPTDRFGFGRL